MLLMENGAFRIVSPRGPGCKPSSKRLWALGSASVTIERPQKKVLSDGCPVLYS